MARLGRAKPVKAIVLKNLTSIKAESLQENFDFGGLDPGKWTSSGGGVVIGTNLDLEITCNNDYELIQSINTYDLTGSYMYSQVVDAGNQALASFEVYPVYLIKDANNKIYIRISGGTMQPITVVAGASNNIGAGVSYNSTTMKYFRVRESGGTIYYDYASDPTSTWTNIASTANPFAVTALTLEVLVGTWNLQNSTAKIDNINTYPTQYQFTWQGLTWNKRIHQSNVSGQKWEPNNISVDGNGYLNLLLGNPTGNQPYGCEVFSVLRDFGYGIYTVTINTELDNIGHPIGFGGMFLFDFTSPPDYKEIDVDETRDETGHPNKQILKNHAYNNSGVAGWISDMMDVPSNALQTHRLIWTPTQLIFDSFLGGDTTGTNYWHDVQNTNLVTPGLNRVHFNIFVDPSISGYLQANPVNVVVQSFTFQPVGINAISTTLETASKPSTTAINATLEKSSQPSTAAILATLEKYTQSSTLAALATLETYAGYTGKALQYDGSQNYLSLGTLGSLGSNLGNGFYCKFNIKATSTSSGEFGVINGGTTTAALIWINYNQNGTGATNKISVLLRDDSNKFIQAGMTNTYNFTDGNPHLVEIFITPNTNTVVIKIDGQSQAISYQTQTTPATFSNFNKAFLVGARNDVSAVNQFYACTVDNFTIGTSPANLYGIYPTNEGTGTTVKDYSGNNNDATLTGSTLPTWVTGLDPEFPTTALLTILEAHPTYSTEALLTILETAQKNSTAAILTTLEEYVKSSTTAINTILEANKQSTSAILTILESHSTPSTIAVLTILESLVQNKTNAVLTILEEYVKNSTTALLTTLEANRQNTTAILTTLETFIKNSTVAAQTIMETASKPSTEALLTILEKSSQPSTTAMLTILEEYAKYSTTAISTTLEEYSKPNTAAIITILESATKVSTTALLSILETSSKPNTTALLTILEEYVKYSTTAMLTTLETVSKPKTNAVLTILEEYTKYVTTAILTTLETSTTHGTTAMSTTLETAVKNATNALNTTLEQSVKNTTAIFTNLIPAVGTGVSTNAVLTILEAVKQNTTALITIFEEFVKYSSIATNVTLETSGKRSVLLNKLLSYYKMDGDSTDSIGSANGTDHTISYVPGVINKGANFAASTDYIDLGNNFGFERTDQFSIAFWFISTSSTQGQFLIGKMAGLNAPNVGWAIEEASGDFYLLLNAGASFRANEIQVYMDTHALSLDGNKHFIVITYDGSSLAAGVKMYFDNVLQANNVDSDTLSASILNAVHAQMGGIAAFPSDPINYTLDEIPIYNRVISPAEINVLWNNGLGLQPPFLNESFAILTTLEANGISTAPILTTLEKGNFKNTAILTILESLVKNGTIPSLTILEKYPVKSTAALLSILEAAQKGTIPLNTILEKGNPSDLALLTILEQKKLNTTALFTLLETVPKSQTTAVITLLALANRLGTVSSFLRKKQGRTLLRTVRDKTIVRSSVGETLLR